MCENIIYHEEISSKRTTNLFILLTLLFLLLLIWRITASGSDIVAGIFLFFCGFFLFYSVNFRILKVKLTSKILTLKFGIFKWKIPLSNVCECHQDDEIPLVMRYGGAGIHFMFVDKRYRASFNFLEYNRILLKLKRRAGLVRDISFSTQHPQELMKIIQQNVSVMETS